MSSSILGIGQSALAAAQAGLATTGHNIANASTPGYSRQIVVQGTAGSQLVGGGYIGKGTMVMDVRRIYSDLLGAQVRSAQTAQNHATTYHTQLSRINNLFADPASGLSPALQDFFKGVQEMAANPNLAASRQSALSSAEALAARFQSLAGQIQESEQAVNGQIQASIGSINVYAQQIAQLNDAIERAGGSALGKASNDLLDQRDYAIAELSKEIKTTVVKQGESYNVFIGNGQPLVMGARTFELVAMGSPTDPTRISVGYSANGRTVALSDSSLPGGKLGGLLDFRSKSLDPAQNMLGRVAIVLASSFNAQHALGQDLNGEMGGDFFRVGAPSVAANRNNASSPAAEIGATITDPGKLTGSDYLLETVALGADLSFRVTRLSDGAVTSFSSFSPLPVIDGVQMSLMSGMPAAGDSFLIRPTVNGAADFGVVIKDVARIAAAAPVRTAVTGDNAGSGAISAGVVADASDADLLKTPVTITFTSATEYSVSLTGVTPAVVLGTGDTAATGGSTVSYNGWTVELSGEPIAGDTFTIGPNINGVGDSRNAALLGALQTNNTIGNGTTTYQGAYAQLVSQVGNKTRELELTGRAEIRFLEQALVAQQSESGVNLDEEATNLMRYQQAYQAAGKVMQTANQLFDLLLRLGG